MITYQLEETILAQKNWYILLRIKRTNSFVALHNERDNSRVRVSEIITKITIYLIEQKFRPENSIKLS